MAKKKELEAIYYPVPQNLNLSTEKPSLGRHFIELVVRSTLKGAYRLKDPQEWDYRNDRPLKPKAVATENQIEMVTSLIESIHPQDAIEAALASQFVITYIRGLQASCADSHSEASIMRWFEFGHKVLEMLQKYRNKGAQQISVQYNVNQGQVLNIKAEMHGVNDER